MSLQLDDVVPFDVRPMAPSAHGDRVKRRGYRPSRREFLRHSAVVGAAVGVAALGVLPPARRAWAGHPEDRMAPGGCSANAGGSQNDDCSGCNPGRPHCCCADSGWHRHDGAYSLRPQECNTSTNSYDGWKWHKAGCCPNGKRDQTWRCHDGWRMNMAERTVCKRRTAASPCS